MQSYHTVVIHPSRQAFESSGIEPTVTVSHARRSMLGGTLHR